MGQFSEAIHLLATHRYPARFRRRAHHVVHQIQLIQKPLWGRWSRPKPWGSVLDACEENWAIPRCVWMQSSVAGSDRTSCANQPPYTVPMLKENELAWYLYPLSRQRSSSVHGQADRTGQELRCSGSYCHRERAAARQYGSAPTDLTDALKRKRQATSDVLRIIFGSTGDLTASFRNHCWKRPSPLL